MMTATATRRLHAVPDAPTILRSFPGLDITAIAEAHDDACDAALEPDIIEQQTVLIARAMTALSAPGADFHAVLRDYGQAMFVIGHLALATTPTDMPGPRPLEVGTLAALRILEQRDAADAKSAHAAEKAVKSKAVAS